MIIKNIPTSFLSAAKNRKSRFAFSDDSRFIYVSCKIEEEFVILVYDNKYNKSVILKAVPAVTNFFQQIPSFHISDAMGGQPYINSINEKTVVISFDSQFFGGMDNASSAMIILIRLDFSNNTFLMIDHKIYNHCYFSYLLQDGSQFALLHISLPDDSSDEVNECRCFLLEIDENQISETRKDYISIDYNNFLSYYHQPSHLHFHNNKIWFLREVEPDHIIWRRQLAPVYDSISKLSYFDLNESIPIKETTADLIEDDGDYYIKLYYSGGFLFYFPNRYEYKMFNLHTKLWSTHKNNAELHMFDVKDKKLIEFGTQRDKRGKTDF